MSNTEVARGKPSNRRRDAMLLMLKGGIEAEVLSLVLASCCSDVLLSTRDGDEEWRGTEIED